MKITAPAFHPQTGQLLPAYRDAYLRGDLSDERAAEVDAYLRRRPEMGAATLSRFSQLHQAGHQVKPVGWVQRQFELVRAQPKRIRQRAAAIAAAGVLVSGLVMASTGEPGSAPTPAGPAAASEASSSASLAAYTVSGRILDEEGQPLVGATIIDRTTGRGVSTNAEGQYRLRLPLGKTANLQYAYAGYQAEELSLDKAGEVSLTLLPSDKETARDSRLKRLWSRLLAHR